MVFSSVAFLFWFLPALIIVYMIVPKKLRNIVLTLGSLIFYAWGEIRFIPILVALSVQDYFCGRAMDKNSDNPKKKKLFMLISVINNVLVLAFFKYFTFLMTNINLIPGVDFTVPAVMLPIGVSFNTFQSISYSIDIYRGDIKCEKNYLNYLTFTTLFPQIVAGPIVRFSVVGGELRDHPVTAANFSAGMRRFLLGLGKKVLIANNVGYLWSLVSAGTAGAPSVALKWFGIIGYTFQIYFDFSGYSDMAIGIARVFGLTFDENFNYPYISKSITEFWRRWHITLGRWFRDYVYIPLGGNRVSALKHLRNLFIVWALTGLWHGASWNFVIWGLFFAVLLVLEKYFLLRLLERLPSFFSWLYTMFFVVISWVIFSFDNMGLLWGYIKDMFGFGGLPFINSDALYFFKSYAVIFILAAWLCTDSFKKLLQRAEKSRYVIANIAAAGFYVVLFAVCVAYLVEGTYNPFLYFRF